jgi:hypothetical protein
VQTDNIIEHYEASEVQEQDASVAREVHDPLIAADEVDISPAMLVRPTVTSSHSMRLSLEKGTIAILSIPISSSTFFRICAIRVGC